MMHTIISLSDIFADDTSLSLSAQYQNGIYREYLTLNGQKQLHRLFSTNPRDYLDII